MRDTRVLEAAAHMLGLMGDPPNLRDHPQPNDRPGAFSHWFDGGVIIAAPGYTLYEFADGAWALWPQTSSRIFLQLPDGTAWSLSKDGSELPSSQTASSAPAPVRCSHCQHDNTPDSRFCSECGQPLTPATAAPAMPEPAGNMGVPPSGTPIVTPQPAPTAAPSALETIPPIPAPVKKCPHCGVPNKPTARFCLTCGKPMAATAPIAPPPATQAAPAPATGIAEKTCPNCHATNAPTAHHCQKCGAPLP